MTEYSPILKKVSEIPEINIETGLKNVAGMQKIYEKSLRILKTKIPEMIDLFNKYLGEENLKEFTIYIHSMKSSLATVGASDMSALALNLEIAAKAGNLTECKNNINDFIGKLSALGDKLVVIFDEEEKAADGNIDPVKLKNCISRIETALKSYDYTEIESAMNEILTLGSSDNISELKKYVDNFDYGNIENAIKKFK